MFGIFIPEIKREFIVFSDIVKQSYIRNTNASVLRVVYSSESHFAVPFFIPIGRSGIGEVRIYIRDLETGAIPTESVNRLNCTLGYRKKEKRKYGN